MGSTKKVKPDKKTMADKKKPALACQDEWISMGMRQMELLTATALAGTKNYLAFISVQLQRIGDGKGPEGRVINLFLTSPKERVWMVREIYNLNEMKHNVSVGVNLVDVPKGREAAVREAWVSSCHMDPKHVVSREWFDACLKAGRVTFRVTSGRRGEQELCLVHDRSYDPLVGGYLNESMPHELGLDGGVHPLDAHIPLAGTVIWEPESPNHTPFRAKLIAGVL